MLVLTRKIGEKLVIGDNIVVTVVQLGGNKVRLSIDAPTDVRVLRAELGNRGGPPAVAAPADAVAG